MSQCKIDGCPRTVWADLPRQLCDEHLTDYTVDLLEEIRDLLRRQIEITGFDIKKS